MSLSFISTKEGLDRYIYIQPKLCSKGKSNMSTKIDPPLPVSCCFGPVRPCRRKHTWHPRRDSVSSEEEEDSDEEHGGKTRSVNQLVNRKTRKPGEWVTALCVLIV